MDHKHRQRPLPPKRKDQRRKEQQNRVHPVDRRQRGQQRQQPGRRGAAAASLCLTGQERPKEQHQDQVGQRVFQAGGRIVDKSHREAERQDGQRRPGRRADNLPREQHDGRHRHGRTEEDARVVRLAGNGIDRGKQQHPQGMGICLNPLFDVPGQSVAVDQVVRRAERDEGIVAEPSRPVQHEQKQPDCQQPGELLEKRRLAEFGLARGQCANAAPVCYCAAGGIHRLRKGSC